MNIREMVNPWSALAAARQEVSTLKAEVARLEKTQNMLLEELDEARKNDTRGKDGRYSKRK
jgi:hypothetical protein